MTSPRLTTSRQPLRPLEDRVATGLLTAGGVGARADRDPVFFWYGDLSWLLAIGLCLSANNAIAARWGTLKAALSAHTICNAYRPGRGNLLVLFMSARLR